MPLKTIFIMITKCLQVALMAMLCSGALLANSNDPILVKSSVCGTEIALQLANLEGQITKIELRNLDNEKLIWTNTVRNHNGYRYEVDLADLNFGRYYIKVTKGDVIKRQVVVVGENGVLLSEMN